MSQILLRGGGRFDFLNPDPSMIRIEDIAHALSHLCRFTGHTEVHYSVAQHSVLVMSLVPDEHKLSALLHDAAEAYLGDVAAPLKRLLPDYQAIERRVESVIRERFGLPAELPACVIEADRTMLATEMRDVMWHSGWREFGEAVAEEPAISVWSPAQSRWAFLRNFCRLTKQRGEA